MKRLFASLIVFTVLAFVSVALFLSSPQAQVFGNATTATNTGTGTTTVLNKPAGTVSGNWMVAILSGEFNVSNQPPVAVPSAWATVGISVGLRCGNPGSNLILYQHCAGAGEPSSYTWTWNANVTGTSAMLTYKVGTCFPTLDTSTSGACFNLPTTLSPLTTAAPNDFQLKVAGWAGNTTPINCNAGSTTTFVPSGGSTQRVNVACVPTNVSLGLWVGDKILTASGLQTAETFDTSPDNDTLSGTFVYAVLSDNPAATQSGWVSIIP